MQSSSKKPLNNQKCTRLQHPVVNFLQIIKIVFLSQKKQYYLDEIVSSKRKQQLNQKQKTELHKTIIISPSLPSRFFLIIKLPTQKTIFKFLTKFVQHKYDAIQYNRTKQKT
eukprot:TRINITY_DN39355_c0_g1_i1.p3 TRINITY_DN39355_c0_g1~~TRINITY_DN39355_c0_g1_i1.p3  ORF type:complete len:112 (-),score=1.94 TRINITY_DN39355_c0_g1_i1:292-627(-)